MKYIVSILQKNVKKYLPIHLPKPLGRWNKEYCEVKLNQKIDLSNEDHCGPCGQYALLQSDKKIKAKNVDVKKI